jgi:uncharacterized membrane protein YbaN (DUF454 family)
MKLATVGKWAFIVGLVLAGVGGLFSQVGWVVWVLAILGVIVGLLNITTEDTQSFLLAAIAFVLSATALNTIPFVGGTIGNILGYVAAFVAGATIVAAVKTLFVAEMKPAIVGKWAFIAGLVLAGVVGLFLQVGWMVWALAILGVVIGLLNIIAEDTQSFLLAAIAFALSATALNTIPFVGGTIGNILGYVAAFVGGATIVAAAKTLFVTAR